MKTTTPTEPPVVSTRVHNRELMNARLNPICALLVRRGARKRGISEGVLLDELILHGIGIMVKLDSDEAALLEAAKTLAAQMADVANRISQLSPTKR